MRNLAVVVENYSAGGSDRIAQLLCDGVVADNKYIFVNARNNLSILNRSSNYRLIEYNILTIPELGMYCDRFNKIIWYPIKIISLLLRYPLIIIYTLVFIKYIHKYKINILISNNGSYPGGECNRAASLAGVICKIKKNIMIFHNYPVKSQYIFRFIENFYDRYLDNNVIFISVAKSISSELLKLRNFKKKPHIVYSGVINQDQKSKNYSKSVNILNVGELSDRKNQLLFVDIVGQICKRFHTYKVSATIVGSQGQLPHYKQLIINRIRQLNLEHIIELIDFKDDISSYYVNSNVYIHTSKVESLPLTILEAMSHGKPIISFDTGDIKYAVKNGINGYVVNKNSVEEYLEAFGNIMMSESSYCNMCHMSQKIQNENYSLESMIQKYNNIIYNL